MVPWLYASLPRGGWYLNTRLVSVPPVLSHPCHARAESIVTRCAIAEPFCRPIFEKIWRTRSTPTTGSRSGRGSLTRTSERDTSATSTTSTASSPRTTTTRASTTTTTWTGARTRRTTMPPRPKPRLGRPCSRRRQRPRRRRFGVGSGDPTAGH